MCYIAQCSKEQANDNPEVLGAMVNNGEVDDDDGGAQSRITNDGESLQRSLASYLESQRRVAP